MCQVETFLGTPDNPAVAPPGYVEGYPRIVFTDLRNAVRHGRPLCAFLHPGGTNRGHVYAVLRRDEIDLSYFIKPFYGVPSIKDTSIIALRTAAIGQGRERTLMLCPRCQKTTSKLVFFRDWACQKCRKLYYRSLATTRLQRLRQRERVLERETDAGPLPSEHWETYDRKLIELDKIKEHLDVGNRRLHIHSSERYLIDAFWLDPAEDAELAEFARDAHVNPAFESAVRANPALARLGDDRR